MTLSARNRLLALLLLGWGCGGAEAPQPGSGGEAVVTGEVTVPASAPAAEVLPAAMRDCSPCHVSIIQEYLEHGMAASVGPAGEPEAGAVVNPLSGARYEISIGDGGPWLTATYADGGKRRQRLVGRIGAGIFDISWVGAEVDVVTGAQTGRLFFAPVETVTGHGLELSPFDTHERSPGLDLALDEGCLTCHTDSDPGLLAGAARAVGAEPSIGAVLFPSNALGDDAFAALDPIGCASCHGDVTGHLEFAAALTRGVDSDEIAILRLGELEPGRQRDVCARCHLQGDVRFELAEPVPGAAAPLAGRLPALVPAGAPEGFRFVGQLERLALSACFRESPAMTCTTCHRPHSGVARQGTASFDAACSRCHELCSRPEGMAVVEVTGEPARSAAGCVDCHVRRSQPFDLPHVRSADHFVGRRIPPPESGIPHREFARPEGAIRLFDDGRLAAALASDDGRRWHDGVVAMGLVTMGRFAEARELFAGHPEPGTPAARAATAPPGLVPLETAPSFHEARALALLATGEPRRATLAFGDALAIAPLSPAARMGRARLRLGGGDLGGALEDTQALIEAYPGAEQPWELRLRIAEGTGRPDLALAALRAYTGRWPSNAVAWKKLGLLLRQSGDEAAARDALARSDRLSPSVVLGPAPG